MYQLGRRARRHHRLLVSLAVLFILICSSVITYKTLHLTTAPRTSIKNASASTHAYQPSAPSAVRINKPLYTVDLPLGWKEDTSQPAGYTRTGDLFRSPSADARAITVYLDNVAPLSFAINRALVVTSKGAGIGYGTVSDNCATFTRPSKADPGSGVATGLWQGASFTCDLGNYERNLVGTITAEGANYLGLTGPATGHHRVFITYADNGPSPDYTVFYSALSSFQIK